MSSAAMAAVGALSVPKRVALGVAAAAVVGGVVYTLWPASEVAPPVVPEDDSSKNQASVTGTAEAKEPRTEEESVSEADAKVVPAKKDYKRAHAARTAGNDLFKKDQYAAAVLKYSEAIELSPEDNKDAAKYYSNRAACHAKLHDYDAVVSDCNEAIRIDPTYIRAYTRRGRAYEHLKDYTNALNDYAIVGAAQQEPTADAPNVARKVDMDTSRTIEALLEKIGEQMAEEKIKENKGRFHSRKLMTSYLATFEGHKEKFEDEDVEVLKKKQDKSAEDWYKIGRILLLRDDYHDALQAFGESAQMKLTLKTTLEYAMLMHLAGSEEEAIALLETALGRSGDKSTWKVPRGLDPVEYAEGLVKLANIRFLKMGPEGEWLELFESALALAPKCALVHFHLAQSYCQMASDPENNLRKAIDHLNTCLESPDCDVYTVLTTLLNCYTAIPEPQYQQKALELYKRAVELCPNKPEAYNMRGQWLQSTQNYDEAIVEFDKAIAADPSSGTAYSNKGFILLQMNLKKIEEGANIPEEEQMKTMVAASNLYNEAIKRDPECLEAHINLAMMFVTLQQIDNAIAAYDRAILVATNKRDLATIYGFREAARMRKKLMGQR